MTTLRDGDGAADIELAAAVTMPAFAGPRASERVTNTELLEALGVAVYMTDAAGVITDFNEAAVELWGRRPEIGKDEWCGSWRLYWPDGTPMSHGECPMALTLKQNRPVRGYEAIAERPDGTRVCFIPIPTPLRDHEGVLVGAVNVLVDISDRKAAEQAVRDNEIRLTEALAVKDEFLGLISHELKTPVTTILGNSLVLSRPGATVSENERTSALHDIANDAERLRAIMDDLLVLARAQASQDLTYEPLVVGRVVAECVAEFRRRHPARSFRIAGDIDSVADGDVTYVRQIATNLLSDAVKYSPYDSDIDVVMDNDGSRVIVHVLDRGRGLVEDDCEKIFESFYRSPAAVHSAPGIGVGLAVCKRLVQAMGGEVWAINRSGGGADVGFALPAMAPEA